MKTKDYHRMVREDQQFAKGANRECQRLVSKHIKLKETDFLYGWNDYIKYTCKKGSRYRQRYRVKLIKKLEENNQ